MSRIREFFHEDELIRIRRKRQECLRGKRKFSNSLILDLIKDDIPVLPHLFLSRIRELENFFMRMN